MIPDFESFIRFDQHKQYSHTWPGIFWFDLPLSILFTFIFHNIVRDPLIKNLPQSVGNRFRAYIGFNWNVFFKKHFVIVIYSLLIGIASHLLWDAFTHLNLADPNATDSNIYIGPIRLYILLQYASSVLGLIVVIGYILRFNKRPSGGTISEELSFTTSTTKSKVQYWALVAIIACLTVIISSFFIGQPMNIILLIEISISGLLLALILSPLIQRLLSW